MEKGCKGPSSKHHVVMAIMNSIATMVPATEFAANWPSQQTVMGIREVCRALSPIAELLAFDRFLKEGIIVFGFVSIAEPTRL